ncbi:toxin-antitoxin system HicB family antitoxin [Marispirochaeta sp.]|jgi:predicted transcriptional regulator|uniref:toxin-antitoxin system HicB family antitoxin n=1 Tax=Marispirochaeta sp. TaxID=2038653 RepID=UPI0029C6058E|nr:toxin-antitoxin system HicB family antitoxin [Marispirochaeta sp.]
MSSLSIRIPESLHNSLRKISEKDHVSINQFIASAIAEKITALETEDYLQNRGEKGGREKYLNVLKKVRDIDPDIEDV